MKTTPSTTGCPLARETTYQGDSEGQQSNVSKNNANTNSMCPLSWVGTLQSLAISPDPFLHKLQTYDCNTRKSCMWECEFFLPSIRLKRIGFLKFETRSSIGFVAQLKVSRPTEQMIQIWPQMWQQRNVVKCDRTNIILKLFGDDIMYVSRSEIEIIITCLNEFKIVVLATKRPVEDLDDLACSLIRTAFPATLIYDPRWDMVGFEAVYKLDQRTIRNSKLYFFVQMTPTMSNALHKEIKFDYKQLLVRNAHSLLTLLETSGSITKNEKIIKSFLDVWNIYIEKYQLPEYPNWDDLRPNKQTTNGLEKKKDEPDNSNQCGSGNPPPPSLPPPLSPPPATITFTSPRATIYFSNSNKCYTLSNVCFQELEKQLTRKQSKIFQGQKISFTYKDESCDDQTNTEQIFALTASEIFYYRELRATSYNSLTIHLPAIPSYIHIQTGSLEGHRALLDGFIAWFGKDHRLVSVNSGTVPKYLFNSTRPFLRPYFLDLLPITYGTTGSRLKGSRKVDDRSPVDQSNQNRPNSMLVESYIARDFMRSIRKFTDVLAVKLLSIINIEKNDELRPFQIELARVTYWQLRQCLTIWYGPQAPLVYDKPDSQYETLYSLFDEPY